MTERLRRLAHVFERHPIYFVTAGTAERRPILACDKIHSALRAFGEAGTDHGAFIGSYVLMPDHLHLFVALDETQLGLAAWMKSLKNALSKTLRSFGTPSPHWQKGFFDHVLRSGESYTQKWDYVRANPVRAGLVTNAADWPYIGSIHNLDYRRDLLL
ncbi:MAG: REP-associated tyrosine transposase [Chthoniobacterales bacterium]|jgi:putative transposase